MRLLGGLVFLTLAILVTGWYVDSPLPGGVALSSTGPLVALAILGLAGLAILGGRAAHRRTYLCVPHAEKEAAKSIGARWDAARKSWYVPAGTSTAPFARWLSSSGAPFLKRAPPLPPAPQQKDEVDGLTIVSGLVMLLPRSMWRSHRRSAGAAAASLPSLRSPASAWSRPARPWRDSCWLATLMRFLRISSHRSLRRLLDTD